jgi:hypothetical protein
MAIRQESYAAILSQNTTHRMTWYINVPDHYSAEGEALEGHAPGVLHRGFHVVRRSGVNVNTMSH